MCGGVLCEPPGGCKPRRLRRTPAARKVSSSATTGEGTMNRLVGFVAVIALCLAGCGAQPGRTLMTYNRGSDQAPPLNMVRSPGIYALYPSNGTNPITTKDLAAGDVYGFEKDANGKV